MQMDDILFDMLGIDLFEKIACGNTNENKENEQVKKEDELEQKREICEKNKLAI